MGNTGSARASRFALPEPGFRILLGILLAAAQPLAAQIKSFPVYPPAAAGPGWTVAGDFGSGLNPASGRAHYLGGRAAGALGPLGLMAGVGLWDAASGTGVQLGATVATRVPGAATGSLALFAVAGAGTVRAGPSDTATTYWTFPVGVALIRPWPGAGRRGFTPWLFPRVQVDHTSFAGARSDQFGVGISAGMSVQLTGHLGVHGALDWLHQFHWAGPGLSVEAGERVTMGVGAYWRVSRAP
jgi:hypothetical protein